MSKHKRWGGLLAVGLSVSCCAAGADTLPAQEPSDVAPRQSVPLQPQMFQSTSAWGPFQLPAADPERGRRLALPSPDSAAELAAQQRIDAQRIVVEGFRDPDERRAATKPLEQRFAKRLNTEDPELIAGHYYNGFYYDGTLFYGSDPLSFLVLNLFRRP